MAMEGTAGMFLLLSAVMALGFLGAFFFERTRISDILILLAFGALVGPVLGLVPTDAFTTAAPLLTTLALAMVMFEGGLELHIEALARGAKRGLVLAVAGFLLSMLLLTPVAHYALGFAWTESMILAAALSHTSSVVVFPLLRRMGLGERLRAMIGIDIAVAEVLCIVTVIALSQSIALQEAQVSAAASAMASQFTVAILLGLAAGLAWARALATMAKRRYHYMLTLAVLLALHVLVTSLGGNGPIGVLTFGIVLGNTETLQRFRMRTGAFTPEMRGFHEEVTFFLRTFVFVYLGITMSLPALLDPRFLLGALLLTAAVVVARALAVPAAMWKARRVPGERSVTTFLVARGLATAVLAGIPFGSYGLEFGRDFTAYALAVIILTNVITTVAVFAYMSRHQDTSEEPAHEGAVA
ncbi:MAG TPA: cation:proton antiporter [Candidatus Thermoplasmatota archaeon]|nr:cation:proton antiporter [Candidatus Thermoplasmatota archaeon]